MVKAALLFNGIKFVYAVADQACEWAKMNNGSLHAIFLRSRDDKQQGYLFPSDLNLVETRTTEAEAEITDEVIIDGNMRMLELKAQGDNVRAQITLLVDPEVEELNNIIADCTVLFVPDDVWKPGTLTVESVDLKSWVGEFSGEVRAIGN